jgi:hypothetical protein
VAASESRKVAICNLLLMKVLRAFGWSMLRFIEAGGFRSHTFAYGQLSS